MSVMKRLDVRGGIAAVVAIALLAVLFVGALGFGVWAYQGRQDYKNNVDQKVAVAVNRARTDQKTADNKQFAEDIKQPFRTYKGPEAYGSVSIMYPRTWSAYVDDDGTGSPPVNGYFQPDTVPATDNATNTFALRLQVLAQSYDQTVNAFTPLVQEGKVKVTPYSSKQVPSVVGIKVDGQIADNKNGTMVVLPLRDKTLELSTEASQYENDFNTNILPNFTFSP